VAGVSTRVGRKREASSYIGTSGYVYPGWRGRFYPDGLPASQELAFASRALQSIEINRSFYSLLTPAACLGWHRATPAGFVFALKGSSFITHSKKLRNVEAALANFFASGPLALAQKLGPIVWQLPKTQKLDAERLDAFLAQLPRTLRAAAQLARGHDQRVKHGAYLEVSADLPIRHVLEPRHESFLNEECLAILRAQKVALAVTDSPDWPRAEEPTADFMYFRLHGSQRLYASQYTQAELARWAAHVRAYRAGALPEDRIRVAAKPPSKGRRDVYVYFDNDAHAYAPEDAQRLIAILSQAASTERAPPL
jgi:uncharacterized protein YecE (DUF72 family)